MQTANEVGEANAPLSMGRKSRTSVAGVLTAAAVMVACGSTQSRESERSRYSVAQDPVRSEASPAPCECPSCPEHGGFKPAPAGETAPMAAEGVQRFALPAGPIVPPEFPEDAVIPPLPQVEDIEDYVDVEISDAVVALGDRMFHDTRLSDNLTMSCASCHDLRYGGTDRAPHPVGSHGSIGEINTPTVYNSVLSIAQFWDGRAADLEEQANGPVNAPGEMGASWELVLPRLKSDEALVRDFAAAFDDVDTAGDITAEHVLRAISVFEATLVTPDSRYDQWLQGDEEAMNDAEKRGYALFDAVGCSDCHYGEPAGGRAFQKLGHHHPYFSEDARDIDLGRYNVTQDERDRHVFKVPSLRNVAVTGPWFHDGSVETLDEAVRLMAYHQVGVTLHDDDIADLVAFLEAMTGKWKGKYLHEYFGK